jgi:hypothetical protein
VAALGVEDPSQESLDPLVGGDRSPPDELPNGVHPAARLRADGVHLPGGGCCLLGHPLRGRDTGQPQVLLGSGQTLVVDQGQSEAMEDPSTLGPVGVRPGGAVAADHAAQIPPLVVRTVVGPGREAPGAEQAVVDRQVSALHLAPLGVGHVLPAAVGQKTVIAARDQLRAVLERRPVGPADGRPVVQHLRRDIAPVNTPTHGAVDEVAGSDLGHRFGGSVAHQYRGLATETISTRMTATPVGIDGVPEGHGALRGHRVDDGPRVDLEKLQAGVGALPDVAGSRALVGEECAHLVVGGQGPAQCHGSTIANMCSSFNPAERPPASPGLAVTSRALW